MPTGQAADRRAARRSAPAPASPRRGHRSHADLSGVGQSVDGDIVEIRDPQGFQPGPADPDRARYLQPEPLIESDAPEIIAEAQAAVESVTGTRAQAERLTRHVNAILEKKPTVSLPSAREVLRTKVGDCNEHTALYVAMARAIGIPARIAVGLVSVRGAFYYHAWPEVYIADGRSRGMWLPVDPTLNEFPADATHLRLARGGLDKQAAILPLIGRLQIEILDVETAPNTRPSSSVAGADDVESAAASRCPRARPATAGRRRRTTASPSMIAIHDLVKRYGTFTAVNGVSSKWQPARSTGSSGRTARARRRRFA